MKYKKVIVFDVDSANDIVQMENSGAIQSEIIKKENVSAGSNAKADMSVKKKGLVPLLFNTFSGASVEGNFDVNGTGEFAKFSNKVITNTILTDFIKITSRKKDYIKLEDYKLEIIPESYAYFMLLASISNLIDTNNPAYQIPKEIDISKLDSFINDSKGYCEFLAINKDNDKIILRINFDSFRNNYSIQDITNIEMSFVTVFVGEVSLNSLKLTNFLIENNHEEENYKMFDVILGGIN